MVQHTQNDESLSSQNTDKEPIPKTTDKPRVTASKFYKEFVQFAIFLGVVIIPIYVSFDLITDEFRSFVTSYIEKIDDKTSSGKTYILEKNFARAVIIFLLFLGFTTLFFVKHALQRPSSNKSRPQNSSSDEVQALIESQKMQIDKLQGRIKKDMLILKTIHNQIYHDNSPRLNYASIKGIYYVGGDGDLRVYKDIIVRAADKQGHFWTFYATGDDGSQPLENIDDMNFAVTATDKNTDLLFLPTEDEKFRKSFAVYFLPLLKPGESRRFTLFYEWPGSFLPLIEKGSASYDWKNRTYTTHSVGDFYAEWIFDEALGEISCRNTASKPEGLELIRASEHVPCKWIFQGEQVPLGNVPYELTFTRL